MNNDYVFYIYVDKKQQEARVIHGDDEMLKLSVELAKLNQLFAVFKVGECVGDFS